MGSVIAIFEKYGLGLVRDGTVVLDPHNPMWEEAAIFEIDRLSTCMGNKEFSFHHIGSTSIPNICAKPILDLLILTPSLKDMDQREEVFKTLGYEYKGEYGIPGRRYCVLYNTEKTKGYVHIHAFTADHIEADRHLLFCDYLRAVPEVAMQYQKLKLALVSGKDSKRSSYTEAKAPFIENTLSEARKWRAVFPVGK